MSKGHSIELAAAAAAALERLDLYHDCLDELLRSPDDTSLYRRNSDHFEAMRGLTATLPHVRICWVDVLISRVELLDAVWRTKAGQDADRVFAGLHERHLEALRCFRRHCWDYISSNLESRSPADREREEDTPGTVLQILQSRVQDTERRVKQQRALIERLERLGVDASSSCKTLGTLQDSLDGMRRALEVALDLSGYRASASNPPPRLH